MIIYRPHRGGLRESMAEAREFESVEAMKEYIVQQHTDEELGKAFDIDDIVIGTIQGYDYRIGWKDERMVCTKRYYFENYMDKYGATQCIGVCSTDYGSLEQSIKMCELFYDLRERIDKEKNKSC